MSPTRRTAITTNELHATTPVSAIDLTTYRVIHRALVRDARLLASVSIGWSETTAPGRSQLRAIAAYFDHYFAVLHHHHTGEDDVIWPAVTEGGGEESATLASLSADHDRLDPVLERLTTAIHELADRPGDPTLLRRVADGASDLADLLESHIAAEEEHLFPVIPATVTVERWAAVERRLKRSLHPRHVGFFAAWLASAACADEAGHLPLRAVARLTGRRFARRADLAFGSVR